MCVCALNEGPSDVCIGNVIDRFTVEKLTKIPLHLRRYIMNTCPCMCVNGLCHFQSILIVFLRKSVLQSSFKVFVDETLSHAYAIEQTEIDYNIIC